MYKNKEDIGSVGDIDVRRRLAQFDTGDCCSLGQRSAVTVVLRQNSLQLVNELLLQSMNWHQNIRELQQYMAFDIDWLK